MSPVDGRVYVERLLATPDEINEILRTARHAHRRVAQCARWPNAPPSSRASATSSRSAARRSPKSSPGRWAGPARYAPNEVRGTLERARHMIAIAPQALRGPRRRARRRTSRASCAASRWAWCSPSPPGTTRILIAVNSVVPALMAGNAVILKHSAQTPLCAERFAECLEPAGLPQRRVPGGACLARGHRSHHPRSARRLRGVHGLGGRRPCRAARGGVALHRRGARARRLRSGVRAPRRQPRRTPSRTSSTARISIPGSPAADCSACTCITALYQKFVEGFVELTRQYVLDDPTRRRHDARAAGAHRGGRQRARADRCVDRGRRQAGASPNRRSRRASAARRTSRRRCC